VGRGNEIGREMEAGRELEKEMGDKYGHSQWTWGRR
jgi:hypothetical protein